MRRRICTIIILFVFVLITGCGLKNQKNVKNNTLTPSSTPSANTEASLEPVPVKELKISDYFPVKDNVKYIYTGEGNEYASYEVYTDYEKDGRIQTRTDNGGTVTVQVLEIKDGQLNLLLRQQECYYRDNLMDSSNEVKEVLLKEPLVKGTEWKLSDNRKRYISNVDTQVTTPAGSFQAIEVVTEDANGKTTDYFAPNIGLVKTVYDQNNTQIISKLSKIEENTVFSQTLDVYYPDVEKNVINILQKKLTFHTNDITRIIMENAIKSMSTEQAVLTTNASINSLYLGKDKIVYVDFNKAFVDEMNAGSEFEQMILQSITNTLGKYYRAEEVSITIEGKPYESGHIALKKGDTFEVSTKKSH